CGPKFVLLDDEIQNKWAFSKDVAEYVFKCLFDNNYPPLRAYRGANLELVVHSNSRPLPCA
ncbi:MAG: hypothetical protein KAJ14_11570, partial [Candidatus Omnitrophica bacterium]|nr:hypothetical protein [Candidatus Omnitrophota bacterium]